MVSDVEMRRPVSFPGWHETLEKVPDLEADGRERFRRAICGCLKYFVPRQPAASVELAAGWRAGFSDNRTNLISVGNDEQREVKWQ